MSEKCLQMLKQGIRDYIQWMTSAGYSPKTCQNYMSELSKFLLFICQEDTAWDEVFTLHTLKAFQQEEGWEIGGPASHIDYAVLRTQPRIAD